MLTNIRYILLTALRDRLFAGLLAGIVLAAAVSSLLGSTAFIEEQQMTVTYAAATSRLILMVGMIVFVCFHIRDAFDSKEMDVILSRPISRGNLVIALWMGFSLAGILLTAPVIAIVGFLGTNSASGYIGWSASLMLEVCFVVAMALFAALTQKSALTSVLSSMGFYILSRMMAFFIMTAESGVLYGKVHDTMKAILQGVSILVPRLDFFSKTEWLIYGFTTSQEWIIFVAQAVIFIPLLLLVSIIDFRRRQF